MPSTVVPPPPRGASVLEGRQFSLIWAGWFRNIYQLLLPGINVSAVVPGTMTFQNGILVSQTPSVGLTVTVPLAQLTPAGAAGSLTFVNGILVASVAPT